MSAIAKTVSCAFRTSAAGGVSDAGNVATIAEAKNVPVGGKIAQVAAGVYHTCALLKDGHVRCWGMGTWGQLGYNSAKSSTDDGIEDIAHRGNVPICDDDCKAVQIVAGGKHTCALLENGKVRCWGNQQNGALGYGGTVNVGDVLDTKKVVCWGAGSSGALGYGNLKNVGNGVDGDYKNITDAGMLPLGEIAVIALGGSHTCALAKDFVTGKGKTGGGVIVTVRSGGLRCWGAGAKGQLGYGDKKNVATGVTDDDDIPNLGDVGYVPLF